MGKFGWSLPPGCSQRDIDNAYGEEPPEDCVICKAPLDEENMTGTCPAPKDCAAQLQQRYKEEADAEAKYLEESAKWSAEYEQWLKDHPEET